MQRNYIDRALRARDPRYAKIVERLGYATKAPKGDLADLRAEYQDVFGKKPFMGWDADTLRAKIDAKKEAD